MRLVTINSQLLKDYKQDPEMLHKSKRPCVLVIQLKYKGRRQTFAVPIRSNINASAPKDQYFPLPPRRTTRAGNRHGIHYIKMFPVLRSSTFKYRTQGNAQAELMKQIIDRNEKQIIKECQDYLIRYENGFVPQYATNIDLLLQIMHGTNTVIDPK